MIFSYQKTYFNPPAIPDEAVFTILKSEISKNPQFEIDKDFESFSQHFKGLLTAIKIAGGYFLLYLVFCGGKSENEVAGVFNLLAGLSMMTLFFCGIFLLLEGRSYATYLKDRKNYYDGLKYLINISNNYQEFRENFYG
jgi:hypothetical protein